MSLQASDGVLIMLASIAAHAEEAMGPGGHPLDVEAMRGLLAVPELQEWLAGMRRLGLLPVPR